MNAARAWLPKAALSDGRIEVALGDSANAWSSRWFRSARPMSVRMAQLNSPTKLSNDALRLTSADQSFCFSVDKAWLGKLAIAALGLKANRKLSPADQAFLEGFGREAASDLANEASHLFATGRLGEATASSTPTNAFHFTLSMDAGAAIFNCYAEEETVVSARRRMAARIDFPAPLGTRARALEQQPVTLGARVGESRLPLSTATALNIGDVIVLDRPRTEPAAVTINGARRDGARWQWRDAEVRFELERTS